MKKLVLMFAAVAAISFASCDNKKAEAPVVEEDTTAVDSIADDSLATDSVAEDTTATDTTAA